MDDGELTRVICERLAAAGVGVWRLAGPAYTATETGIFYGSLGATPDRALAVAVYLPVDDIRTGLSLRYLQVRSRGPRGTPDGADTLAGAVFDALHGTYPRGGIARITRTSAARLGADGNSRQERTDNYLIVLDNP